MHVQSNSDKGIPWGTGKIIPLSEFDCRYISRREPISTERKRKNVNNFVIRLIRDLIYDEKFALFALTDRLNNNTEKYREISIFDK
jgi:hypothetical protein